MYKLYWHRYKLMDYEKKIGIEEVQKVLNPTEIIERDSYLELNGIVDIDRVNKLTYFERLEFENEVIYTQEFLLENSYRERNNFPNRQITRYSVHGMHEYKGKYNPQIVRSIINLLGIQENSLILDPFCGSGTTLVESEYSNITAIGTDINKLAVKIANSKLRALSTDLESLMNSKNEIIQSFNKQRQNFNIHNQHKDERLIYLQKWFLENYLNDIECLKNIIQDNQNDDRDIFLIILSNIIKEYSEQEPADLRIRRRYKTEYPEISIIDRFEIEVDKLIGNISISREVKEFQNINSRAKNIDIRELNENNKFDGAITSPPYATALPYIDTQRLSLVWMGLCEPSNIGKLQSILIGSREINTSDKRAIENSLRLNEDRLPQNIVDLCLHLNESFIDTDGFRKRAVPILLYRYFSDMSKMFSNVLNALKADSKFALVVGHNHTVIGGTRYDIDTPSLLVDVAIKCGWIHDRTIPLDVYNRYGLHQNNAIADESLIILRKNS